MIADFRSDTVTKPDAAMRRAMADAEVGDDVLGDDPTVRTLEERVAELFGRPASLFLPTGTMANQVALGLHAPGGGEALFEERAHTYHSEAGGAARLWGLQSRLFPSDRGVPDPVAVRALVRSDNLHHPRTRVCVLENTHNFHGGRVVPLATIEAVRKALPPAVRLHVDGARIWNAHVASGTPLAAYAAAADTLMASLSKGLGCPAGSMLVGEKDAIGEARRLRKLLGGGMRQVGVLAAPALVALGRGFAHIAEDHRRARRLAEGIGADPALFDTNIVIVEVPDAPALEARLAREGVLTVAIAPTQLRFVTHRDVGDREVEAAIRAFTSTRT